MPKAGNAQKLPEIYPQIMLLVEAAMDFVPRERGEHLISKWLQVPSLQDAPEFCQMCAAADAILLTADLLRSQPSLSGSTAFDRLCKSRAPDGLAQKAAMDAVRAARFRLLRISGVAGSHFVEVTDELSGAALSLVWFGMPALDVGTPVFGRMALIGQNLICPAGVVTPLDWGALAIAKAHPSAGAPGVAGQARWAEAVYAHVVRHGTLDIPGLNRPMDPDFMSRDDLDPFGEENDPLLVLVIEWAALKGEAAGEALLRRTRPLANEQTILDVLCGVVVAREEKREDLAAGFERVAMTLLETVQRRETAVSGGLGVGGCLTLDSLAAAIEAEIAGMGRPRQIRALFLDLRRRLTGRTTTRPEDADFSRLMQRIQALRAKTVDQGCTEHEALAAAEKVAELLDRYGLSLGELDFREQPCGGVAIETTRRRLAPVDGCATAIGAFFDCRVWVERAPGEKLRYVFFGLRADVAAAQYLFEMVERVFETETAKFRAGEIYTGMAGERRTATNSFQIGLGKGIRTRLKELRSARDSHLRSASGRDLVPLKAAMVEEEIAKLGLDLRTQGHGGKRLLIKDAFAAGEEAGRRFEYVPGISEAA